GSIVDVIWNGSSKDATKKSKIVESVSGKYGMEKAAKQGAWHVQAEKLEAAIVKAGDPSKIALKSDGKAEAVSGVTISANVVALAIEALKAAK
ncbi:MAG: FMN-binding protein, partial [Rectinema sp.]